MSNSIGALADVYSLVLGLGVEVMSPELSTRTPTVGRLPEAVADALHVDKSDVKVRR